MFPQKTGAVSLLIVDDHDLVRMGLRSVFDLLPEVQIVGEAATGADAVSQTIHLKPDIVLLDIRLPDCSGIEACRKILAACPKTRVLFLTSFAEDAILLGALLTGAHGYVLKQSDHKVLVAAIRAVAAGHSLLDPQVTMQALAMLRARYGSTARPRGQTLSQQEERVLSLVAEGKTNKEIGETLGLSGRTVQNYLAKIYEKLQVSRRAQATAVYLSTAKSPSNAL